MVWAIKKFRCYLEGYSFTVVTDHSSLRWLHNLKDPVGRLGRWALELLQYDYKIVHRKGALHHVPDALSRIPESSENTGHPVLQEENKKIILTTMSETQDVWYLKRYDEVERKPQENQSWKIHDGRLYFHRPLAVASVEFPDLDAWKLVLPRERREDAIKECHSTPHAGHMGIDKTYRRVSVQYFWKTMFKDITRFVSRCDICQRTKTEQKPVRGHMGSRVTQEPWMVVAADIMGPYTASKIGHQYILVIQDQMTKYVEVVPLKKANGKKIRESLEDYVYFRHGSPIVLITDNGTEFNNKDIQELTTWAGTRHRLTPPYHPQADPVERVNRVLKTMLRAFIEGDHQYWDQYLSEFRFAYNTAYHEAVKSTPAFANHGREPRPPASLRQAMEGEMEIIPTDPEEWTERMRCLNSLRQAMIYARQEATDHQANYYNLRHRKSEFFEGQLVLRKTHPLSNAGKRFSAALEKPFDGPYVISKKLSPVRYELTTLTGKFLGQTAIKELKPWIEP